MTEAEPKQKRPRAYRKHGLYRAKRTLMKVGSNAIDMRFTVGKELLKWKADLIADLGGNVSTQQCALIDLGQSKLLLDSVDSWLLIQPTLVNQRNKSLIPVVRERTQLADSLSRYLLALGLQRVEKESPLWPWERVSDRQTDQQDATPNDDGNTDGGPIYNARNSNADVHFERISRPPWFDRKDSRRNAFL